MPNHPGKLGRLDTVVSHPCHDVTFIEYVGYNNRQSIRQCGVTYASSSYRTCLCEMPMQLIQRMRRQCVPGPIGPGTHGPIL